MRRRSSPPARAGGHDHDRADGGSARHGGLPGANGPIAFVRGGDIHTMTPEGGEVRRLTRTGDAFFQSWSADGERLVFTRFRPGRGDLWTMDADGTDKRRLLRTPGFVNIAARFSPDGATVIFGRCGEGRNCTIWRVNADGSGLAPVIPFGPVFSMHPSFAPSGDSIAFWLQRPRRGERQALFVADPDAGNRRRLTPRRLDACCPDWAPDGSALVFHTNACDPNCPRRAEIWTVRPDGTGLTRLTHTQRLHDLDPAWSPDGTAIAFERRSANHRRQSVYVMPASGGRPRLLQRRAQHPRWGPAAAGVPAGR